MKKPKFKKHPAKMTSDELAEGVFHPKVLRAVKEHLEAHGMERTIETLDRTAKNLDKSTRILKK